MYIISIVDTLKGEWIFERLFTMKYISEVYQEMFY